MHPSKQRQKVAAGDMFVSLNTPLFEVNAEDPTEGDWVNICLHTLLVATGDHRYTARLHQYKFICPDGSVHWFMLKPLRKV